MKVENQQDGTYEIIGVPGYPPGCGPYRTQADAREDLRGMKAFFKNNNDPIFSLGDSSGREWIMQTHDTISEILADVHSCASEALDCVNGLVTTGEASDSKTNVMACETLLKACRTHTELKEGHNTLVMGKKACEEMMARSKRALENGGNEMSIALQEHALRLAKPIAKLMSLQKSGINLDMEDKDE